MAKKKIYITYDERLTPQQALQYASRASTDYMTGIAVWANGVTVFFKPYRKNPNIDITIEENAD